MIGRPRWGQKRREHQERIVAVLREVGETYGWDLSQRTGIPSGSIYAAVTPLIAAGTVLAREEKPTPELRRQPRRYYRLADRRTS